MPAIIPDMVLGGIRALMNQYNQAPSPALRSSHVPYISNNPNQVTIYDVERLANSEDQNPPVVGMPYRDYSPFPDIYAQVNNPMRQNPYMFQSPEGAVIQRRSYIPSRTAPTIQDVERF